MSGKSACVTATACEPVAAPRDLVIRERREAMNERNVEGHSKRSAEDGQAERLGDGVNPHVEFAPPHEVNTRMQIGVREARVQRANTHVLNRPSREGAARCEALEGPNGARAEYACTIEQESGNHGRWLII